VLALSGTPVTAGQVVPAASIGSLTWAPVANSNGVALASFTFQVQDDGGTANGGIDLDSSPNTITLDVTPVNDPPVAVDDSYLTGQDTPVTLSLVANDTDIDGDTLQVASINGTAVTPGTAQTIVVPHGTVKISAAGVLSFVPDAGYVGTASFDYVVSDGHDGTDTGTVSVTVLAITPVPAGDTVSYVLLALLLGVFARGALQAKRLQRRRS
jgi:hypothetical protein